jgi:hypothetical protein
MRRKRRSELSKMLALDGFTPGAPPAVRPETLGLDAAARYDASCPHCGQLGLAFVPYRKAEACRGLSRCERCGEEIEM